MKASIAFGLMLFWTDPSSAHEEIQFNRDVRPILAEHCWSCHGFDEAARKAMLRLDVREHAIRPAESGLVAIVPDDPEQSELVRRITTDDHNLRMPPDDHGRPLKSTQIETLRLWIIQGANFQRHWAFEPLARPVVPEMNGVSNSIDAFVAARLAEKGLTFSPAAPRETLLRRLSFDLTGLPPSVEDLDRTIETYDKAVLRLLSSPHFGEHMAADWLDAARYADTNGYFSDKPRQMWLWRDWVINAFNSNMPFDQFTVEQLAGDLLPNATSQQRIATGFNRNHVANNETGIIDEEFRTEYVVDRVDTTMTTWMGLTAACAQCHDHKFDPISQKEFYQLFAFFNNVPETGLIVTDNPPPVMTVTSPQQEELLAALAVATAAAWQKFEPIRVKLVTDIANWEGVERQRIQEARILPTDSLVLHESFDGAIGANSVMRGNLLRFQSGIRGQAGIFDATQHIERAARPIDLDAPWTIGFWVLPEGSLSCPLSKIQADGDRKGLEVLWQKGRVSVNLVARWGVDGIEVMTYKPVASGQWHHIVISSDGSKRAAGLRIFIDGRLTDVRINRDSLSGSLRNEQPLLIGRRDSGLGYYGVLDEFRIVQACLDDKSISDWFFAERIGGILEVPAASRSERDAETLIDYYIENHTDDVIRDAHQNLIACQQAEKTLRDSIPTTLVMEEMAQPRTTHVLFRGLYNYPEEVVGPGVPAVLSAWPNGATMNRLGFSQWLVAKENPLTARVAVNRLWKVCFGEGLVRTVNDFGTQGEPPTHPELLDWLAVSFQESGWDVKAMLRLIVSSRTYQQESSIRKAGGSTYDPQNRLLSRGPAFRLSAEMIRDQALAVSGLLRRQLGGPSVKPYQPPGMWEEVSYNQEDSYVEETGDGLWRRSVYTYLKRQMPPPSFLAFDGTTREKCTVHRARTNTPLQSLILLNDPTYVEAARSLAMLVLRTVADENERVEAIFRRILCRAPDADESKLLIELLHRQQKRFPSDTDAALKLVSTGASNIPDTLTDQIERTELAAWTIVAHTILNLDEAITRR